MNISKSDITSKYTKLQVVTNLDARISCQGGKCHDNHENMLIYYHLGIRWMGLIPQSTEGKLAYLHQKETPQSDSILSRTVRQIDSFSSQQGSYYRNNFK